MKIAAFVLSSIIGYLLGHYLLEGALAAYASILISYHIYLVLLIILAEHERAFSMPIGMTILTHTAFVAFLVGFAYMRYHIPFFSLLRLLIPGLAPFEVQWLFSGDGKRKSTVVETPIEVPPPTAEDYAAFEQYLKLKHRPFSKPGRMVEAEFQFWLADRAQKKAAAAALAPVGSPGGRSAAETLR